MAIDKNTITKEAQKFAAKGQFDKAIAEWKKLLKEAPNDPNIYNTIGDLCLKKDSKASAVEAYHKAADLLAADGFTSKAIAVYKKILNIDYNQVEVHLALGDMNVEKGLIGNALENFKYVADYHTNNKDTVKALTMYQKMADLNDSDVAFRVNLGDMYAKAEMKAEAARAYLTSADVHLSKNAFKEARHLFEKVLALDPGNKEVYYKAGIVYFKEGKFVEACKALKPAFESDPSNKDLLDIYLEALDKAGKDVEIEQVLRKLLSENPDNTDLRERLYNLYLARKDFEKAIVEAGTLAEGKIKSGNPGDAEAIYKTFVAGSPYFPPIRQKLAELYVFLNRPRDAATELMQAAELFVAEGDLSSARAVLTQAIEIVPDLSEASEQLEKLQTPVTASPPPEPIATTAPPIPVTSSPVASEPGPPVLELPPPAPALPPASPVAEAPVLEEEDPAIIEAFTESDVLIKYGLAEKAVEQLEALSSTYPENPRIRIRLRDLYHGQGKIDKAVQHALLAVALYAKYGQEDQATTTLQETFEMAPEHPAVLTKLGRMPVAPEEPKAPDAAPPPEIIPDEFVAPLVEISQPSSEDVFAETIALGEPAQAVELESEEPGKASIIPEPEEIQASEIMPDYHDASLTGPEISPPPSEELPGETIAPQEPVQTGEIEFDGLDSGIPPLEETLPVETAAGSEPLAIEQPVAENPPFGELSSVAEPPTIVQQPVEGEPPFAEIPSVAGPSDIEQQDAGEVTPFAETPSVAEPPTMAQQPVDEEPALVETTSVAGPPTVVLQPVGEEPQLVEITSVAEFPPIEKQDAGEPPFVDEVSSAAEPAPVERTSIEKELEGERERSEPVPVEEAAEHEPPIGIDIGEILAEAEFYYQQGLFDEAKKHYTQIIAVTPDNQRVIDRLAEISREEVETQEFVKLTDAVEGLEGYLPPAATEPVLATSASDDEAVRALMQEIQQLKQQPAPPPPPPKEKKIIPSPVPVAADAGSRPAEPEKKTDEEDFFDLGAALQRESASAQQGEAASEEFFDLAAELRDELGSVPIPVLPAVPAEEQSLDDIFAEFKKGVEQHSAKEDADTHYNLGVAYKEMGLLDDAINEFMMTPGDEPKFAQSRYMLGLCYMEKGEYHNAISEIQSALDYAESKGFDADNRIEMHYDLGLACQCAGNISGASDEFQKVFDQDPEYRDTVAKLKELQKGDYISLEQLKDDIEKEISSKFLEEGVRIEREEKTRKNERVGK